MGYGKKRTGLALMIGLLALGVTAGQDVLEKDRGWVDRQGRGVEGRIVQYNEYKNTLQFQTIHGKRAWIKPTDFSEDDQTYIEEWISADQFLANSKLQISIKKRTKNGISSYEMTFKNNSTRVIAGFKIGYKFHIEIESFKGKDQEKWKAGSLSIASLAPKAKKTYTISSGEGGSKYQNVTVTTTSYNGSTSSSVERHKVSTTYTRGVLLRLQGPSLDGTPIIRELAEPKSLAKKHKWNSTN